jgi:hypothetical protein
MVSFDVFISYSSKDKTAADAVCAVLEGAGIRCWVAPRDIRPGVEYGAAIIEAIDQCRVMILIFSSSANNSGQIRREIERAVSKSIPLIPVRIEEVVPTKSLEYFLGAVHWLDALTPPLEQHLQRLAQAVKALLSIDASSGETSVNDGARKHSTPNAVNEIGRLSEADRSGQGPVATGPISRHSSKDNSRLLAGLLICTLAALAGVVLYHTRSVGPNAPQVPTIQPGYVTDPKKAFVPSRNPNGVWAWGFTDPYGQGFVVATPFAREGLIGFGRPGGDGNPSVLANLSSEEKTLSGRLNYPPGEFSVHPGPRGEHIVLRFTSPEARRYTLDYSAEKMHTNAVTVEVIVNGVLLSAGDTQRRFSYTGSVQLKQNEVVDLSFGLGQFGYNSNSTRFTANVSPLTELSALRRVRSSEKPED